MIKIAAFLALVIHRGSILELVRENNRILMATTLYCVLFKLYLFLGRLVTLAKKRNLNPNRFQKQDKDGLFSLDPVRRDVLKWGAITGASGGFLMLQQQVVWQIIGVFIIVFGANYHISKAARYIPRWQATVISFAGVIAAMVGVIIVGTIIMAYYQPTGG